MYQMTQYQQRNKPNKDRWKGKLINSIGGTLLSMIPYVGPALAATVPAIVDKTTDNLGFGSGATDGTTSVAMNNPVAARAQAKQDRMAFLDQWLPPLA